MAVTIKRSSLPEPKRGHSKALPRPDLDALGRLYVGHLITLYGLAHSTIYAHLRMGLIPPPDGEIAGRPYWRTETIRTDLER